MTISQNQIPLVRDVGVPGQLADGNPYVDEDNLPNAAAAAAGVYTVTVGTVSGGETVSFADALTGGVASVVAVTDAATTGPLLAAAFNAVPELRGRAIATAAGAAVTITMSNLNQSMEIGSLSNATVATTTSPAEAPTFPFGVPVYLDANGNAVQAYPGNGLEVDLYGISKRLLNRQAGTVGSSVTGSDGRTDVVAVRTGRIYVAGGSDAVKNGVVYVGVGGGDEGQFFAADSGADRDALPKALATWYGPNCIELKLGL